MKMFVGMILSFCLLLGLSSCGIGNETPLPSQEIVNAMGAGWNLGNSLDCIDINMEKDNTFYETVWDNPVTTEELICTVKEAGFGAVRVPVTYYNHLDENGQIDKVWLKRVKEVVDYVLNQDMYCIINLHHDTGNDAWIVADYSRMDEMEKNIANLWTQIAEYFKDYDEHLLFEGYNEILDAQNHWGDVDSDTYQAANVLNQRFIDSVRATGGNNKARFLVVNTYAAGASEEIISNFRIPTDSIEHHLIMEVHNYSGSENESDTVFQMLSKYSKKNRIPIIFGEFGIKHDTDSDLEEQRMDYTKNFVAKCRKNGFGYFWWDDGGKFESADQVDTYALIDRYKCEWYFPELAECLTGE